MKIKLGAYSLREVQNMKQVMMMAIANKTVTVHDLLFILENHIKKESARLSAESSRSRRGPEMELSRDYRARQKASDTKSRTYSAELQRSFPKCPECEKGRLQPTGESTQTEWIMLCWNCHYSELWPNGDRPEYHGKPKNHDRLKRMEQEAIAEMMTNGMRDGNGI